MRMGWPDPNKVHKVKAHVDVDVLTGDVKRHSRGNRAGGAAAFLGLLMHVVSDDQFARALEQLEAESRFTGEIRKK